ncbi:MAG: hypothetical protein ABJL72_19185 [Roseobacter sp.]
MAEVTGTPYRDVMMDALIPGLLNFIPILYCVYLRVSKSGMEISISQKALEPLSKLLLPDVRFMALFYYLSVRTTLAGLGLYDGKKDAQL